MQVQIIVEVDDATKLDKLLLVLARECQIIENELRLKGIESEAIVHSAVLEDGEVLFD